MNTFEELNNIANRQAKYIAKNSERFIKCFIAKTGCQPDEVMLIYNSNGMGFYPVDKRSDAGKIHFQLDELLSANEKLIKENRRLKELLGIS